MHIVQKNIRMWSPKWLLLHSLQIFCLFISITGMIGSIVGVIEDTRDYQVARPSAAPADCRLPWATHHGNVDALTSACRRFSMPHTRARRHGSMLRSPPRGSGAVAPASHVHCVDAG